MWFGRNWKRRRCICRSTWQSTPSKGRRVRSCWRRRTMMYVQLLSSLSLFSDASLTLFSFRGWLFRLDAAKYTSLIPTGPQACKLLLTHSLFPFVDSRRRFLFSLSKNKPSSFPFALSLPPPPPQLLPRKTLRPSPNQILRPLLPNQLVSQCHPNPLHPTLPLRHRTSPPIQTSLLPHHHLHLTPGPQRRCYSSETGSGRG